MKAAILGGAALLALTSCAANEGGSSATPDEGNGSASTLSGVLSGQGASSQGSAQAAWIATFQQMHDDNVTIEYEGAGSGAGRETFAQGASAFAGSDRAFKLSEIEELDFAGCSTDDIIEFPAYISPIAIVFNLDGITSLNLTPQTVAKIFTGEITTWNDPAIAADNSGVDLPDTAITAVHRSDKSGTTGNFTEYLAAVAPDEWTHGSVEEWPLTSGEGANQTSGMADVVAGGVGTIGYIDASRAGTLGTVAIKVGNEFVEYSPEAAAAVVDASSIEEGRTAGDIAIELDRTTEAPGVYPIVLISYLIGCESYVDASNAELVKAYFSYIVSEDGQKLAAAEAGSAPISAELRSKIEPALALIS